MPWKYEVVGFEGIPTLREAYNENTGWDCVAVCIIRFLWPAIKPPLFLALRRLARQHLKAEIRNQGDMPWIEAMYVDFNGKVSTFVNADTVSERRYSLGDWFARAVWHDPKMSAREVDQTVEGFMDELFELAEEEQKR
jgi:hypothetical protein